MRAPSLHRYTWAEYLALERTSNVRHEFLDGEIYALAGGTPEHAALAANVIGALHAQLAATAKCRVFSSDLRVRVTETGLGTYPDATVVCGELARDPQDRNTITNPTVVVEVLSDSTEAYDRGMKLDHLRRIPELREIVLVSHREPLIEVFRRGPEDAWTRSEARLHGTARLEAIGCELVVDAVYAGIELR